MREETEGRERPIQLTEAELKQAAAGKSEALFERKAKPIQLTEADLKQAAAGKSEQVVKKKTKK
jgi:hypothetical protein